MQKKLFCGLVLALSAHAALAVDLCTPATVNAAALLAMIPFEPIESIQAMMACPPSVYVTPMGLVWAWSVPITGDSVRVSINATGQATMAVYAPPLVPIPAVQLASRDIFTGKTSWVRGGGQ